MIDSPGAQRPDSGVEKPTILIVEDEVLVRLMLGDALREQGYAVIEAAQADEAVTVLRSAAKIDIVLTDIRMPGSLDGLDLARIIRSEFPHLKVALASAYSVPASELEAHAFIRKPYNLADVATRVRGLIGE